MKPQESSYTSMQTLQLGRFVQADMIWITKKALKQK